MSTDREPKPKMRRFRAGLLAFLAFALAIGAGLAWVAVIVKRAHDQRQIVAEIRQAGGEAYYDYQVVDEHVDPTREPPGTTICPVMATVSGVGPNDAVPNS